MADESFKEFVLDQLRALPDVRAKRCSAHTDYIKTDQFFGILDEGRLFFKTDAQSADGLYCARHGTVHLRDEGARDDDGLSRSAAGRAGKCAGTGCLGAPGNRGGRPQREVSEIVLRDKGISPARRCNDAPEAVRPIVHHEERTLAVHRHPHRPAQTSRASVTKPVMKSSYSPAAFPSLSGT